MFFRKKIECEDCGCILRKDNASTVTLIFGFLSEYSEVEYFCKRCTPKYDKKIVFDGKKTYYKNIGYQRCDENGNLIPKNKSDAKELFETLTNKLNHFVESLEKKYEVDMNVKIEMFGLREQAGTIRDVGVEKLTEDKTV